MSEGEPGGSGHALPIGAWAMTLFLLLVSGVTNSRAWVCIGVAWSAVFATLAALDGRTLRFSAFRAGDRR